MDEQTENLEKQTDNTTLKIETLAHILAIVDAACERGAFKGDDMSYVGLHRDNLKAFLETIKKAEEEKQKAAEESSESSDMNNVGELEQVVSEKSQKRITKKSSKK